MSTIYTKEKQKLTINNDEYTKSPREWSNLGFFITIDREYNSPDNHPDFEEIIRETGEEANDINDHMKMIKKEIKSRLGEKVLAIYPIAKYEHSGVLYSLGERHGFDYSNNGFYIITEKNAKEIGTPKKSFEKVIKEELKYYNQWVNGEMYEYTLEEKEKDNICKCCGHNLGGEYKIIDSCGGFFDKEEIFSNINEKENNWNLIKED